MEELKHLAIHCDYGALLDNMLRDRLICSINEPRIQRRLLGESNITFQRVLELALAMETADMDAKDLQGAGSRKGSAVPPRLIGGKPRGGDLRENWAVNNYWTGLVTVMDWTTGLKFNHKYFNYQLPFCTLNT